MSLEALERGAGRAVVITGALAGAYMGWAEHYKRGREVRLPEGGTSQSTLPFYAALGDIATEMGLEYTAVGGIPKQALRDPETVFDPKNKEYIVSNPTGHTLSRATLFRPDEHNLRDLDLRAKRVLVNGEWRVADTQFTKKQRKEMRHTIQGHLDGVAAVLGFPKGPEVSLFFYEDSFGNFRPWHYATRTQLSATGEDELLYASTGASAEVPVDKPWSCVIRLAGQPELAIPTDSPRTQLGRTLNRPVKARVRDLDDVDKALLNIRAKGLEDALLGEIWSLYGDFRGRLNSSLSTDTAVKAAEAGAVGFAVNLLLAHMAAPLAPKIESMVVAQAIRDPETLIGKACAKLMGAA